jgi:hypothetical protein
MQITVKVTKNYGLEAIYPVCETAKTFTRLTRTRTFSREALDGHIAWKLAELKKEAPNE